MSTYRGNWHVLVEGIPGVVEEDVERETLSAQVVGHNLHRVRIVHRDIALTVSESHVLPRLYSRRRRRGARQTTRG